MTHFEIKYKDWAARIGKFQTGHGTVTTPLIMPVVHPGKSVISPSELQSEFDFQMLITNSYIIRSHERFSNVAEKQGLHSLLDFDGPIMTDSGTFQMYFHSLPDEEIDPLEIVRYQRDIGSDIGTILDVFSDPKVGRSKVEDDVRKSLERARLSVSEKGDMFLAGTIQGGTYPDLREASAKAMAKLDFEVHPVGGVVPLMERYQYSDIVDIVMAAKKHLPHNRPVHLFGCGHPMFFAQAALLGCDFFDSASYAKFAESGRMLLPSGTVHLENLRELPCECPACKETTADNANSLNEDKKVLYLMRHNLYVTAAEMRRVRQAIRDGRLFDLVAQRARGHPALYEALQKTLSYYDQIEMLSPLAKGSAIFYTGQETTDIVDFRRYHRRTLERYANWRTKTLLVVPHSGNRPVSETTPTIVESMKNATPEECVLLYITPIGIVPWELEHVYPAQQYLFPESLDYHTLQMAKSRAHETLSKFSFDRGYWIERETQIDSIFDNLKDVFGLSLIKSDDVASLIEQSDDAQQWTRRKFRAVLSHQWGKLTFSNQYIEDLTLETSRSTGKIRYVKSDNEIVFTLVPTTGYFTPTFKGAEKLLNAGLDQRYVVSINDEVADYIIRGKSALAKFVTKADSDLRAGEEVLVVNSEGSLLGAGRALLGGREMIDFDRGVAVNIRHSKGH